MLWLSADIAEVTGLALWRGPDLIRTAVLRKRGEKGCYLFAGVLHASEMLAWLEAFRAGATLEDRPMRLIVESVHVDFRLGKPLVKPALSLAKRHGRVEAWWKATSPERADPVDVDVNTWRAVARQTLSHGAMAPMEWTWPKSGDDCKPVAQALVRQHYGLAVTGDEAEAVLVGHWALRTSAVGGAS